MRSLDLVTKYDQYRQPPGAPEPGNIVAVDFDGTIARTDFPHIVARIPGAFETLIPMQKAGYILVLWTSRANHKTDRDKQYLDMAVSFCRYYGLIFDSINWHSTKQRHLFDPDDFVDPHKVFADYYIDDHNVGKLPSWNELAKFFGVQLLSSFDCDLVALDKGLENGQTRL